jgi:hypothetical protein
MCSLRRDESYPFPPPLWGRKGIGAKKTRGEGETADIYSGGLAHISAIRWAPGPTRLRATCKRVRARSNAAEARSKPISVAVADDLYNHSSAQPSRIMGRRFQIKRDKPSQTRPHAGPFAILLGFTCCSSLRSGRWCSILSMSFSGCSGFSGHPTRNSTPK